MNLSSRLSYTLVVLFTICRFGLGSRLVLTAHPQNFDIMTHELNISCQAQGLSTNRVAGITVEKKGTGKLVSIDDSKNVVEGRGFRDNNMKAGGYIGTDDENAYLNVTIDGPNPLDAGIYKCRVDFVYIEYNFWHEKTSVSNVTFVERDVTEKVSFLMTTVKEMNNDMTKEQLNDLNENQEEKNHLETGLKNTTKKLELVTEKAANLFDLNKKQDEAIGNLEARLDDITKKLGEQP